MKKAFKLIRKIILYFLLISVGLVLFYRFVPVPFTPLMIIRLVEQGVKGENLKWDYRWRSYDHISRHLPLAVFCAEDQKFLEHHGFDLEAIKKAISHNEKGRKLRGGSTISQQVAKNVFLWQGRTYLRKGMEAYFTVLIELFWPKKRIMEVYVNVVEMGDGIYGAQAASRHYWKKDAIKLNREQAALLAAILPSPRRYNASSPGPFVSKRQRWIIRQMNHFGNELDYNMQPISDKNKQK